MAPENADGLTDAVPWSAGLRALAARFGDRPAVTDGSGRLSYKELCARAHALAARLIATGIKPGAPVATLLPNGLDAAWVSYAVRLSGAAETPLNWGYTPDEIAWCAHLARFDIVITSGERAKSVGDMGLDPLERGSIGSDDPGLVLAPVPADANARILFTSGTTGRPKGVVYTHGRRWIGEQLLKATLPFTPLPGSRILVMTPFPHGASLLAYAWCDYGGEVVLLDGVETAQVLALLREGCLDAVFAPPTVLAKFAIAFGNERFRGVQCVFTGTQPLAPALYDKAHAMFGPVVRITYGKTECINPITVLPPADVHDHFTSPERASGACVGWPAPGVELQIQGVGEPGTEAHSDDGEVWLRARHMSNGIIDADGLKPHEPDGWHRTGDLGRFDGRGALVLTGRLADVIKTGGYRVNPDEIEAHLTGLRLSGQVCVTSIPSDYWGEIIVAMAEGVADGWRDEALERVAGLSRHKRPRIFLDVENLPRNPQGKISRRQVSQLISASYELGDGPYPTLTARPAAGS